MKTIEMQVTSMVATGPPVIDGEMAIRSHYGPSVVITAANGRGDSVTFHHRAPSKGEAVQVGDRLRITVECGEAR